ncbi:hypothetical protein [Xylella fastidiosa]|uniref:hypothetical protein n=1 Tax=Xylella fastidiosa TaxID=2371 RepID=UPI00040E2CEC|nr:hypothetical protein [Xylella fastidiosa]
MRGHIFADYTLPLPLQRNRTHQHITDAIDWKHAAAQRNATQRNATQRNATQRNAISPHFIVT